MRTPPAVVLVIAGTSGAIGAPIVVDDFETGPFSASLTAPGSSTAEVTPAANALRGDRFERLFVASNPFSLPVVMAIGSGAATVSNPFAASSVATLGYGFRFDGIDIFDDDSMNLSVPGFEAIQLEFLGNDLDLVMSVTLGSNDGAVAESHDYLIAGGREVTPFVYSVSLLDFPLIDLGDLDLISISFSSTPSGDFALDGIVLVPAPSGAGLLALAGLLARRRRR